jgi:hypothetical protein
MRAFIVILFILAVLLPLAGMWFTGGAPEQYPDEDFRKHDPNAPR